jgi:hypothetical protein
MGRNNVDTIKIVSKAVTLLRTYGTEQEEPQALDTVTTAY